MCELLMLRKLYTFYDGIPRCIDLLQEEYKIYLICEKWTVVNNFRNK